MISSDQSHTWLTCNQNESYSTTKLPYITIYISQIVAKLKILNYEKKYDPATGLGILYYVALLALAD